MKMGVRKKDFEPFLPKLPGKQHPQRLQTAVQLFGIWLPMAFNIKILQRCQLIYSKHTNSLQHSKICIESRGKTLGI